MTQEAISEEKASIVDLYHPVTLTRGKKKAYLVIGPDLILLRPDDYELTRSLFEEQGLTHLLSKKRRKEEEGIYMFNISEEPKEIHDKLSFLEITVPDSIQKRDFDVFRETTRVTDNVERYKMPESVLSKISSLQRKRVYRPGYKAPLKL